VSTLVHANKTEKVSREGGSRPFDPTALGKSWGKPVYKRPACNPETEMKACVCLEECVYTLSSEHGVCVCL
jgi:hypothetical protein